jgi:hypothetical protein
MPTRAGRFEALYGVTSPLCDCAVDQLWTAAAKPAPDRLQNLDEALSRPRRGEGAALMRFFEFEGRRRASLETF